jgi:EH domain-containing protein 1
MKQKLLDTVDKMLSEDIAGLMSMIPLEEESHGDTAQNVVKGGAFQGYNESPFGVGKLEGTDKGRGEEEWVVAKDRYKYDDTFQVIT